ncbi:MAG: hypothetical protein LAN62_11475 [Acidobacteriia bacterium]|nr:hypothetical protein [Terriglobia bacterium]
MLAKVTPRFFQRHGPLLVAIALLLLTVYLLLVVSLRRTQGNVVYALDDAYIHMAMAKNLVRHGVWGITADGFTSTSSSPLWTLLLATTYLWAGVNTISPFVMALFSACLVLLVAYTILHAHGLPPNAILLSLFALILLTPLPALIFGGMEHTLQTALTLAAAFLAARVLSLTEPGAGQRSYYWLLGLAPLITAVRFEGMFFIFVVSVGFILRRQVRRGGLFALLGFLPIVSYGLVSKLHGWPWVPTSVLLKSGFASAGNPKLLLPDLLHRALINLRDGAHLVALILLVVLLDAVARAKEGWVWNVERVMAGIFAGTGILQLGLARVGWFYRYDAYLVALGILAVACRFRVLKTVLEVPLTPGSKSRRDLVKSGAALLLIISVFLCSVRGAIALKNTPQATANIFQQQFQMAMFVKRFYAHSTVALNDVGAVNYFADIHCLDLLGVTSPAVARLRMRGAYCREDVARLAADHRARIAIVPDFWFDGMGGLPSQWVRVGQWQIHNNVVTGSDTVSIYAVDSGEKESLLAHLAEFSAELPSDVVQSGFYLQRVDSDRSKRRR